MIYLYSLDVISLYCLQKIAAPSRGKALKTILYAWRLFFSAALFPTFRGVS